MTEIVLTLTNFRCWEQRTFRFPSSGVVLIHGRSGRGKSTILNAIYFAIAGKLKNITSFGKRSTTVTLEFGTMKITRSRNPLKLKVERNQLVYEDDAGQAVLDEVFGRQFASTSYIDQDNTFSFASMSPADKIEFLETFMLEENSVDTIRETIKVKMTDSKVKYAELEGKMSTLSTMLHGMTKRAVPELNIEKNKVSLSNFDKLLEKVVSNLAVCERNAKVAANRVRKYEDQYDAMRKRQDMVHKQNVLREKLSEVEHDLEELAPFGNSERLAALQEEKRVLLRMGEMLKLQESAKTLKGKIETLQCENNAKRISLEASLAELPSVETITTSIDKFKKCLSLVEQLSEMDECLETFVRTDEEKWLANEHADVQRMRAELVQANHAFEMLSKKLECPDCHQTLQLVAGHLEVFDASYELNTDRLEELKKSIPVREKALKTRETLFHQLSEKEKQYNTLFEKVENLLDGTGVEMDADSIRTALDMWTNNKTTREKHSTALRELTNDRVLLNFRREYDEIMSRLNTESVSVTNLRNLEDIVEELSLFSDKHSRVKMLSRKRAELSSELGNCSYPIDGDADSSEAVDSAQLQAEREKYTENEEKIKKYRQFLDQLNEWKTLMSEREKYDKLEFDVEAVRVERDLVNDRIRGLVKLREHVRQAERQCMEDFIQTLNSHASMYLESFFEDDDVQVSLRSTQETKTGKEKISLNFEVLYRQMTGDLSYLSGGERDRVNLAFTLALSEMTHPNILMLDECISSLDAETTGKVLETLKESYKGKLVLLVSHQANMGFFDSVVEI